MRSSMFSAQLTILWYRSTNWQAGSNLSIPVNMRECFRLIDLWVTLYIREKWIITYEKKYIYIVSYSSIEFCRSASVWDDLYICSLFNDAANSSCSAASNGRMIGEWWMEGYMTGSSYDPIWDTVPAFSSSDWGNPRKLQDNQCFVGFEVFTAVVLKSIIFWDMILFNQGFDRDSNRRPL
jgi:hypothetical protein